MTIVMEATSISMDLTAFLPTEKNLILKVNGNIHLKAIREIEDIGTTKAQGLSLLTKASSK
jgi:hypothetical protein